MSALRGNAVSGFAQALGCTRCVADIAECSAIGRERPICDIRDLKLVASKLPLHRIGLACVHGSPLFAYPIHHDKVIIADRQTVEFGSFNYSDAAAHKNSENVLVNWGNPKLAGVYLKHFERNYGQASRYLQGY